MPEFTGDVRQFIVDVFEECGEFQILIDKKCYCVHKWGIPDIVQDFYKHFWGNFAKNGFRDYADDLAVLCFKNPSDIEEVLKIIECSGYVKRYCN